MMTIREPKCVVLKRFGAEHVARYEKTEAHQFRLDLKTLI